MSESDRELLELAAKAAGIEVIWNEHWQSWQRRAPEMDRYGISRFPWNPLTDDGDALRLAVKLGIFVGRGAARLEQFNHPGSEWITQRWLDDPMSATRRAIVLAAEAIGEAMK